MRLSQCIFNKGKRYTKLCWFDVNQFCSTKNIWSLFFLPLFFPPVDERNSLFLKHLITGFGNIFRTVVARWKKQTQPWALVCLQVAEQQTVAVIRLSELWALFFLFVKFREPYFLGMARIYQQKDNYRWQCTLRKIQKQNKHQKNYIQESDARNFCTKDPLQSVQRAVFQGVHIKPWGVLLHADIWYRIHHTNGHLLGSFSKHH